MQTNAVIKNPRGIHARPSVFIATELQKFSSVITVQNGSLKGDAKQTVDLMLLLLRPGNEVALTAEGPDETEALGRARELFELSYQYE